MILKSEPQISSLWGLITHEIKDSAQDWTKILPISKPSLEIPKLKEIVM